MKKILFLGIAVLVIGIGAFVLFAYRPHGSAPLIDVESTTTTTQAEPAVAGMPTPAGNNQMQYTSAPYHFTVVYPKDLGQVTDTPETGGGHTIVFDDGKEHSFQIFITPYSGAQITKERFLSDEPSGVISEQKDVMIDGVRATHFSGKSEAIGETSEVWFIREGFLYEIVTYKPLDTWLADIMKTWKFTK